MQGSIRMQDFSCIFWTSLADPLSQVTLTAWSCFPCFTVAQVLRFRSCTVIECTSALDSEMTIRMPFHSFCLEENHTLVVPLAGYCGHGVAGLQLVLHVLPVFRNPWLDLANISACSHYGSRGSVKVVHRDPHLRFLATTCCSVFFSRSDEVSFFCMEEPCFVRLRSQRSWSPRSSGAKKTGWLFSAFGGRPWILGVTRYVPSFLEKKLPCLQKMGVTYSKKVMLGINSSQTIERGCLTLWIGILSSQANGFSTWCGERATNTLCIESEAVFYWSLSSVLALGWIGGPMCPFGHAGMREIVLAGRDFQDTWRFVYGIERNFSRVFLRI